MNYKKIFTDPSGVLFFSIICCFLWGSAFPVLKISFEKMGFLPENSLDKMAFAGMRFLLASIIIFFFYRIVLKGSIAIPKSLGWQLLLLGIFQTSLQYYFFYNALAYITGMKGAILESVGSFFVVIFAHFLYKNDRINNRKVWGVICGFVGILLVNWGKEFSWTFSIKGEGYLIFSGLVSALGMLLAKELSKQIHPFLLTAWQMFIGSLILLLLGMSRIAAVMVQFTPITEILFIYAALLSAIAFSIWHLLLKYNKAGEVVLYQFMIPVSGALLSTIFIPGEKLTLFMILGLIFVSLGILIVNIQIKEK